MSIRERITSYLNETMVLQIATSAKNIPWVCTVCFAYDAELTLYWFSRHSARHSQEIITNPNVAGAISMPYAFGDKPRGLQCIGRAEELHEEKAIEKGLAVLGKRYEVSEKRTKQLRKELLSQSADYGLYRLKPDTIILYDTKTFPGNPRKVFDVASGKVQEETDEEHPPMRQ